MLCCADWAHSAVWLETEWAFSLWRKHLKTHPSSDSFFILMLIHIYGIAWCKTRLGPTGFKFRLASIRRGCIGIDMAEPDHGAGLLGLAERWESVSLIRQRARRTSSLLEWMSPETTGVPSMTLSSNMNQPMVLNSDFKTLHFKLRYLSLYCIHKSIYIHISYTQYWFIPKTKESCGDELWSVVLCCGVVGECLRLWSGW